MHSWGWCKLSVTSEYDTEKKYLIHEFCVRCFYLHHTQTGAWYAHNDHHMYAGWYICEFWAKVLFKCYLCVFTYTFPGLHAPKNMCWTHKKRCIKCPLCIFGFIDACWQNILLILRSCYEMYPSIYLRGCNHKRQEGKWPNHFVVSYFYFLCVLPI